MKPVNFSVIGSNSVKVRIPKDVLIAITAHHEAKHGAADWHDATTTKNGCHLVACGQGWYNLSTWPHQADDALFDVLQQIEALQNPAPAPADKPLVDSTTTLADLATMITAIDSE